MTEEQLFERKAELVRLRDKGRMDVRRGLGALPFMLPLFTLGVKEFVGIVIPVFVLSCGTLITIGLVSSRRAMRGLRELEQLPSARLVE